jgi:hypothetical protein
MALQTESTEHPGDDPVSRAFLAYRTALAARERKDAELANEVVKALRRARQEQLPRAEQRSGG